MVARPAVAPKQIESPKPVVLPMEPPVLPSLRPERPAKRKYRLSAKKRRERRRRMLKLRPWKKSTGPRTKVGKMFSRMNALKHGFFGRDAGETGRAYAAFAEKMRRMLAKEDRGGKGKKGLKGKFGRRGLAVPSSRGGGRKGGKIPPRGRGG
ncbi:MAG: hypothetical protein ABSG31_16820 [Tepidisphaeraceae bacterium]